MGAEVRAHFRLQITKFCHSFRTLQENKENNKKVLQLELLLLSSGVFAAHYSLSHRDVLYYLVYPQISNKINESKLKLHLLSMKRDKAGKCNNYN